MITLKKMRQQFNGQTKSITRNVMIRICREYLYQYHEVFKGEVSLLFEQIGRGDSKKELRISPRTAIHLRSKNGAGVERPDRLFPLHCETFDFRLKEFRTRISGRTWKVELLEFLEEKELSDNFRQSSVNKDGAEFATLFSFYKCEGYNDTTASSLAYAKLRGEF